MRSSGPPRRSARPSRHGGASPRRRGRPRRPRADRRRALDDRRPSARSARRPRRGWSPGTGRRRRRSSPSAASLGLLRPLVPGRPFLEAEVAWAARHELALSLDDVLARRTRLAQELPDRGAAIAPRVAEILGAELGWDEARQRSRSRPTSPRPAASSRSHHPVRRARPTGDPAQSTEGMTRRPIVIGPSRKARMVRG